MPAPITRWVLYATPDAQEQIAADGERWADLCALPETGRARTSSYVRWALDKMREILDHCETEELDPEAFWTELAGEEE